MNHPLIDELLEEGRLRLRSLRRNYEIQEFQSLLTHYNEENENGILNAENAREFSRKFGTIPCYITKFIFNSINQNCCLNNIKNFGRLDGRISSLLKLKCIECYDVVLRPVEDMHYIYNINNICNSVFDENAIISNIRNYYYSDEPLDRHIDEIKNIVFDAYPNIKSFAMFKFHSKFFILRFKRRNSGICLYDGELVFNIED